MKIFNLFKEIIVINKDLFLDALATTKEFGINIAGEIVYSPFTNKDILIYKTQPQTALIAGVDVTIESTLAKQYEWLIDEERLLIKAAPNWQRIVAMNKLRASYDDTTGYGVSSFMDMGLQKMGWHAREFNIDYREIIAFLEEHADGTIFCIAKDEPYMYHGMGFFADTTQAKKIMFEYCQTEIIKLLKTEAFKEENLGSDQEDAMEYFECL